LSRQYAQPSSDAAMNFVVVSWYAGSDRRSVFAQIASCSIAVPASFQLMTLKSLGW
jgi:hypothetical protein